MMKSRYSQNDREDFIIEQKTKKQNKTKQQLASLEKDLTNNILVKKHERYIGAI